MAANRRRLMFVLLVSSMRSGPTHTHTHTHKRARSKIPEETVFVKKAYAKLRITLQIRCKNLPHSATRPLHSTQAELQTGQPAEPLTQTRVLRIKTALTTQQSNSKLTHGPSPNQSARTDVCYGSGRCYLDCTGACGCDGAQYATGCCCCC